MLISGLQKLSLLDYPGKLAAIIFTGGCNLLCPFCHNPSLVNEGRAEAGTITMEAEEILSFLRTRRGKLDGVCISGGEPLLHSKIENLIAKIRELGFSIKLDTNGTFPEKLYQLIHRGLLDYVALDIKNSAEKYPLTVGLADFDPTPVFESADILIKGALNYKINSAPHYELRTTLVRGLHNAEDIEKIGQVFKGAAVENYYLQRFVDSGSLVGFRNGAPISLSAFSNPEMEHFAEILSQYIEGVRIRG